MQPHSDFAACHLNETQIKGARACPQGKPIPPVEKGDRWVAAVLVGEERSRSRAKGAKNFIRLS
jgi:hypothetical protein